MVLHCDELLLVSHGYRLISDPSIDINGIKNAMASFKDDLGFKGWFIIGHVHRAFLDFDLKLGCAGCWQLPISVFKGVIGKDDVLKAILFKNGEFKLVGSSDFT